MAQLKDGDRFPSLSAQTVAHGPLELPAAIPGGNYAAVLVYRAHW